MNHNPKLRIHNLKFFMIIWGLLAYTYTNLIDRVNINIEERTSVLWLMIDPQINMRSR